MHILAASSDSAFRSLLVDFLEGHGHRIRQAASGEEAWQMLQDTAADLVIADLALPGIGGIELCSRLRSLASDISYTYVLLAILPQEKQHYAAALAAGIDDYLLKPLEAFDLGARLRVAERVTSLSRQVTQQRRELERLQQSRFDQVRMDQLTGLGNRMRLQEDLEVLRSQARRYGYSFSVVLVNIDHFQHYQQRFGITAGDDVLRTLGHITLATCRGGDSAYRYGSDQFLLILPEQTLDSATQAAERLRVAVEEVGVPHPDNLPYDAVTISLGVTTLADTDSPDTARLLQQADAAMYRAMRLGRNRVQAFQPDASAPALTLS